MFCFATVGFFSLGDPGGAAKSCGRRNWFLQFISRDFMDVVIARGWATDPVEPELLEGLEGGGGCHNTQRTFHFEGRT